MKTQSKGFTLIELIMVIVILGILSAFALPRFADFGSNARQATLEGAAGSVRSAAGIARSQFLVSGLSGTTINLDGTDIEMVSGAAGGYPTATPEGIGLAAQLSEDFTLEVSGSGRTLIRLGTDTCQFAYEQSDGQVTGLSSANCN